MTKDRADRTDVPGLEGTPYRVVREIGRGGMGSVHEVQHRALGKIFVMKVLHESLAHREDFALRMKREWRTLARLEHPAIVQVTDAGQTTEGLPFFVMERLDGQTLAEVLHARGRLSPREAAEMMLVVLSGLEAAHRAGAIHRDIKPQNLFLTPRGPKILDFGIAKSKRKGALLVTRSGVAIGTPRYMAPEQAAGLPVDARADVYACGLVLFEMIAGRDPFYHLKEAGALVNAHINETPPRLDDVCPEVPAELGDVLSRWLAKEAPDRPASARLAQIELEALLPLLEPVRGSTPEHPTFEITRPQRLDESTAGSTSVPPSASSLEVSALGVLETVTLDEPPPAPGGRRSQLAPGSVAPKPPVGVDEALAKSPSITPPPVAARAARSRSGSSSGRWALGAGALLSLLAVGLGAVVLAPELSSRARGVASLPATYDFPETPSDTVPLEVPVQAGRPEPAPAEAAQAPPAPSAQPSSPEGPQGALPPSSEHGRRESRAARSAAPSASAPPIEAAPEVAPAMQAAPARSSASEPRAPESQDPGAPPTAEPPPEDLPGSGLW